ncbi:CBS domain-containing protein [bacterium]|nr:CBS domain-containing protein [bacterium]
MKIKDLVRTDYEVVSAQIKISEISERLAELYYLVVKDEGEYVGILSSSQFPNQGDLRVADCLVSTPVIDYESDLEEINDQLQGCKQNALPVFAHGIFKGVLLQSDILKFMVNHTGKMGQKIFSVEDNQADYSKGLEGELEKSQGLLDTYSQYSQIIEKVLKAKSDLLTDVSQELRNHLHIILSYVEQGLKQSSPLSQEKFYRYFTRIHDNSEKMLNLVTDLLDLSKLDAGKSDYKLQSHSLSDLIDAVLAEYNPLFTSKKISVDFLRPTWSDVILMDKNRISQVIQSFISNAYKFSQENNRIRIELKHLENEISLSITDWGCGISQEEFDTLFEKYNRTSLARQGIKGSGLGLPIAYKIVSDHKGKISAKANPEGGAIFSFTLPISSTT